MKLVKIYFFHWIIKNINYEILGAKIIYNSDNFNKNELKNDIIIDDLITEKSKVGISFENTKKKKLNIKIRIRIIVMI